MKTNWMSLVCGVALALGSAWQAQGQAQLSVDSVVTSNLFEPFAVASTTDGTLFLSDGANNRIVRVGNGQASATLFAGQTGVAGTNDGLAEAARFSQPQGIVLARGGLVVADSANHTLRFVALNGAVTTLAGTPGVYGNANGAAASARFRFPLGLAADEAGNIYIADSQNNAIRKLDTNNNVTTVATGFYQPAALSVAADGTLWVADTRRHCVKTISTNGTVTVVAGTPNTSGMADASIASNAQFSSPRGILWVSAVSGVLVSDSGNHTIRRIFWNTNFNTYSVETFAGVPGQVGSANGAASSATFNGPAGLGRDDVSGGFLVVDRGNHQLRRINTGVQQAPVADPTIGWVDLVKDEFGAYVTQLRPVIASVFNNDVVIAIRGELGTQIYYTLGPTPANPLEDNIPTPSSGTGLTPPLYRDGQPAFSIPPSLSPPQPDITIKAIGTQDGRRSSRVVQARFQFNTANPVIIGDNAASFRVDNVTEGAVMYYTWDGSEPTRGGTNANLFGPITSGDLISFNLGESNRTFKIRAYKSGYRDSDLITKQFSATNFVANTISFGFDAGEASSDFVAAAGQRFYAPITMSLLPQQTIYSLQFNVVVTNVTGQSVDGNATSFDTMLMKPLPNTTPAVYVPIPAAMSADGFSTYTGLIVTNPSINLLQVGWIERRGFTNLYDTRQQNLLTYSIAHDTLFLGSSGKAIVGGYSFVVPAGSANGETYDIKLGRVSATSDGISKDVFIKIPTNGSLAAGPINGVKRVTVGSRRYVVGDVAPFRWFNAGDFGDTNLLNNDVVQVFQTAIYGNNAPPEGSDMLDAMDASDGSVNDLFNGNIDQIQFGDGMLNVDDVYVVFRRSLDPSLKWYARYWSNGVRHAVEVPNGAPAGPSPDARPKSNPQPTSTPTVAISVDDVIVSPGQTVQVPVRVRIAGGLPIRVAMLSVAVEALDGSAAINEVSLSGGSGLGAPTMSSTPAPNSAAASWLSTLVAGVNDGEVLATVSFTVPNNAPAQAAYRVRVVHFSGSENGIALFRQHVYDGMVTLSDRSGSSLNDGISDLWRLRHFGSVGAAVAGAAVDADGDRATNLDEFRAGTNPVANGSVLKLELQPNGNNSVQLTFPTAPARTYVLECAPSLSGPWTTLDSRPGDGMKRAVNNAAGGTEQRFYRVRVQ